MGQSTEVKGGVDKSVMPTARPCSTEENNSRCRKSDSSCMLWDSSFLGLGVICKLEMLTEEDRSKATATEGVSREPEFARKKFSVGVDIVMHGVVGGLNGLCTGLGLRDPRVQMRENKMVELASMLQVTELVWRVQEGISRGEVVRQFIMGLIRAVEMREGM